MDTVSFGCHGTKGHQIINFVNKLDGARLAAVSAISDEDFAGLAENVPEIKDVPRYDTLEELLADKNVDAVSLCSPRRDKQAGHLIQSVEAGKHVLAEKPLATSLEQFDRLRAAVADVDVKVVAMLGTIYGPTFEKMHDIVAAGKTGEVVNVFAQKSYGYHDRRPQDRGIDGGLICQAGIHAIDFIRYVTGLEIVEVHAYDTGLSNPREGDLQMGAGLSVRFDNGAVGACVFNYLHPKSFPFWGNEQLRVWGLQGMVELTDGGHFARYAPVEGEVEDLTIEETDHTAHAQAFAHEILGKGQMRHTLEDSLRCTQVVLAAQASADQGKPVSCEPT